MSARTDERSGSGAVTRVVLGESTPTIGRLETTAAGSADSDSGGIAGVTSDEGSDACIGRLLRRSTAVFGTVERGCVRDGSSPCSRTCKGAGAAPLTSGATDGGIVVTGGGPGVKSDGISRTAGPAWGRAVTTGASGAL